MEFIDNYGDVPPEVTAFALALFPLVVMRAEQRRACDRKTHSRAKFDGQVVTFPSDSDDRLAGLVVDDDWP
jgi:hypothetical protein